MRLVVPALALLLAGCASPALQAPAQDAITSASLGLGFDDAGLAIGRDGRMLACSNPPGNDASVPVPLWASGDGRTWRALRTGHVAQLPVDCDPIITAGGLWAYAQGGTPPPTGLEATQWPTDVGVSRDGGATWSFSTVTVPVGGAGAYLAAAGENLVLATGTYPFCEPAALYVARSTDGGRTWTEPAAVQVATDPAKALRFYGNILAEGQALLIPFMAFDSGYGAQNCPGLLPTPLRHRLPDAPVDADFGVVVSRDGGASWEESLAVRGARGMFPGPALTEAGSLVILAYTDVDGDVPTIRAAASRDGGVTWDASVEVARPARLMGPNSAHGCAGVVDLVWQDPDADGPASSRAARVQAGSWSRLGTWTLRASPNETYHEVFVVRHDAACTAYAGFLSHAASCGVDLRAREDCVIVARIP